MKVNRGDIVLLDHPYSDQSGSKVRPVLVVQADVRNAVQTNTVIAMITRNLGRVGTDPTFVLIEVNTSDGAATGLRSDSAVSCDNLFTVHENLLLRRIGTLSSPLLFQVNLALKVALDLP